MIVSGDLIYIIPVNFVVDVGTEEEAEKKFREWANTQKVLSPNGEWYTPGVSQDANINPYTGALDDENTLIVPADGIIIDYVEEE